MQQTGSQWKYNKENHLSASLKMADNQAIIMIRVDSKKECIFLTFFYQSACNGAIDFRQLRKYSEGNKNK